MVRFDFKNDSSRDNSLDFKNVTISLESVFRNNGTAKITQDYTASKRIKDVLEFTKAKGFSNVHTVGVETGVETDFEFSLPFIASGKGKFKVTGKYQWQTTSSGTDTEKRSVENEETYTIRQAIEIPPCTEYHVTSFVKMIQNYSVRYTAFARLTGMAGNDEVMYKNELKLHIEPGMEFIRDLDDFAIEVSVKGEMFAKYGVKTLLVGEGHPIPGCLKNTNFYNIEPVSRFILELPISNE